MNKELARSVLKVIDTPSAQAVIEAYADQEINKAHSSLEGVSDLIQMARQQGVILAMKELKKLRERAVLVKEKEIGNSDKKSNPTASTW